MRLITSIRTPPPDYRDRTGPSRSSPPVQKCCAEMMSVSVARIQKNRCRTTIAERMVETRAELPRAQPGRPQRTCNSTWRSERVIPYYSGNLQGISSNLGPQPDLEVEI